MTFLFACPEDWIAYINDQLYELREEYRFTKDKDLLEEIAQLEYEKRLLEEEVELEEK